MATVTLIQFTPQVEVAPVAPDETLSVSEYFSPSEPTAVSVTPVITQGGSPITPDSLDVVTQAANGTATVNGTALDYSPASGYSGADSFTYKATVGGTDSNTATVNVTVVPIAGCQEFGRVTREYVSAYQRGRIHNSRLVRGEKRCLIANFNGAIPGGRRITTATWYCLQPYPIAMSNAQITADGRTTQITIAAQSQGPSILKVVATLDNGEQYTQMYNIMILGFPWFVGENVPPLGPYQLTVNA